MYNGFGSNAILTKFLSQRKKTSSQVTHKTNGRIPLAYAHIVQALVDSFFFFASLAQYADLGISPSFQWEF
jgi:hypothetical protein